MIIAKYLVTYLRDHRLKLVTAESCTAGGLAYAITSVPGSSACFERGFVTYSNKAKKELLGVKASTLRQYGAVSRETAIEMAIGALHASHADITIATTGIAGPTGGSKEKPVGTVWFAWGRKPSEIETKCVLFEGTRGQIRKQAVMYAVRLLESA